MGTRSIRALAAVGLAGVVLSGCWPQAGYDSGHTRYNRGETGLTAENVASLTEDWSVELLGPPSEPIAQAGRVYVVAGDANLPTSDVEVHAFDLGTGATAWATSLVSLPQQSGWFTTGPVTLAADQLWTGYAALDFTTPSGRIASGVRLDPRTGALLSLGTGDELPVLPVLHAGAHVVEFVATPLTSPVATLRVRDAATASTQWEATFPEVVPSAPVAVDGQVFVGVGSTLYAFALDGCGAPTCSPAWSVSFAADATPRLVATDDALVAVIGSEVLSIDPATGGARWRAALPTTGRAAAATPDTIYVPAGSSMLAFDADGCGAPTCSPVWSGALDAEATASPVVAGGVAYVGAGNAVAAFAADGCGTTSCSPIVTVPVGGPVSSLSVAQGRLLVANGTSLTSLRPG